MRSLPLHHPAPIFASIHCFQGEDADNAKYYSEQSKKWSEAAENALDVSKPSFTVDLETGHLLYSGGRFDFEVFVSFFAT